MAFTTEELYNQAAEGSEQALWSLCKTYEPLFRSEAKLYRYKMADAYDVEDFISIGYVVVWDVIRKGNFNPERGSFGAYLKQAVQWKFRNTFRDFAMKNMVCIGDDEDYYGTRTRAYVIHDFAIRERELTRERQQDWYRRRAERIDAERAEQGLEPIYRPSLATPEQKADHAAQVEANRRASVKRWQVEHADELKAWKADYYQRNKEVYRRRDRVRRAKISIEKWTARGNEKRLAEAKERLARYEAELDECLARAS